MLCDYLSGTSFQKSGSSVVDQLFGPERKEFQLKKQKATHGVTLPLKHESQIYRFYGFLTEESDIGIQSIDLLCT